MAQAVSISPINYLQEICMKYRLGDIPKYIDAGSFGPDHCKEFGVICIFKGRSLLEYATTKKAAKTRAASKMIIMLQNEGFFQSNRLEDDAQQPNPVDEFNKNPISYLQEHCQKNSMMVPLYLENNKVPFTCICEVKGEKSQGQGSSKKLAKINAAHNMCIKLGLITDTMNDSNNENDTLLSPLTQHNEKTAVSILKELCDRERLLPQPLYVDKMSGNTFIVECTIGTKLVRGEGRTKKEAKTEAARKMLFALQNK